MEDNHFSLYSPLLLSTLLSLQTSKHSINVVMSQIKALAEDVQPLLAEARDSGLLQDVDILTRSLTESCEELRCTVQPLFYV